MKKIYLIGTIFTLLGLLISYNTGFKKALKTNEEYKKEIVKETLTNNPAPKCETCDNSPSRYYQTFDADGDGWTNQEIVIIEDVGMSQMAGRVIIIKNGKVVFTSKAEMRIWVNPTRSFDYNNGFIISYSTEANSNTAIARDFYKYSKGQYKLVRTIDSNTPKVNYIAKLKDHNWVTTSFSWYGPEADGKSWFYVSPDIVFGNPGSEQWENLLKENKDAVFRITGTRLDDVCDYNNPNDCNENIYLDDIEVVK